MTEQKSRSFPVNPWILIIAGAILILLVVVLLQLPGENTTPPAAVTLSPPTVVTEEIPYPDVPRISVEETKTRFDAGDAVIVDVRSIAQYESGHIPGSIVIPPAEFEERFDELPREAEILLYCT